MSVKFDNKTKRSLKEFAKNLLVMFVSSLNLITGSDNTERLRETSHMVSNNCAIASICA